MQILILFSYKVSYFLFVALDKRDLNFLNLNLIRNLWTWTEHWQRSLRFDCHYTQNIRIVEKSWQGIFLTKGNAEINSPIYSFLASYPFLLNRIANTSSPLRTRVSGYPCSSMYLQNNLYRTRYSFYLECIVFLLKRLFDVRFCTQHDKSRI